MIRATGLAVICLSLALAGCKNSPVAPSPPPVSTTPPVITPPPPPPPPPVATATVVGVLTDVNTRAAVGGATVIVSGGTYNGRSSGTDGNGFFSIPGVAGTFTLLAQRAGYNQGSRSVTMNGDTRADMTIVPFFVRSGVGDNVFDLPSYVSRVRIQATYPGSCQNFIVRIAGRSAVNVILGTCSVADARAHDGTYVTSGGVVEILSSTGVQWTFTQVQ